MICYLLKSSKKSQFYEYFNHLLYHEFFVYICMRRDDARRIQHRCFINRSILAIPALRKRLVHVHFAAYHFRIFTKMPYLYGIYITFIPSDNFYIDREWDNSHIAAIIT